MVLAGDACELRNDTLVLLRLPAFSGWLQRAIFSLIKNQGKVSLCCDCALAHWMHFILHFFGARTSGVEWQVEVMP
jgi:hypothetical protein